MEIIIISCFIVDFVWGSSKFIKKIFCSATVVIKFTLVTIFTWSNSMQQYSIAARPCLKHTYSETMELVIQCVQYMYKIIYQHNLKRAIFIL